MGLAPDAAFASLPASLRTELLDAFNDIVKNYREHRWEPSELNGGKLCEVVYTICVGWLEGGAYPDRAKKPPRFPDECWNLASRYSQVPGSRSPRILIPRMMMGLYDIRNNRGVGHAGAEVNPNHMDATLVVATAKWLMAELVRLLHALPTEDASAIVEALTERELPWVWTRGDTKRILRTGLTYKQQTLVLLLADVHGTSEDDLVRWLEHPRPTDFRRKVLKPLHAERLIEYDQQKATAWLLPPGTTAAEELLAKRQ